MIQVLSYPGIPTAVPPPIQLRLPFFTLPDDTRSLTNDADWSRELLRDYEGDDPLADDNYGRFERYDAVKSSLGLWGEAPTEYWCAAASRFLGGIGLHALELRPIFSGTSEQLAVAVRMVRDVTGRVRRAPVQVLREEPMEADAIKLADFLPEALRKLPRTSLDPDEEEESDDPNLYGHIDRRLQLRLASIEPEAVRVIAIVETEVFAGEKPGVSLYGFVAQWERVGEFIRAAGIDPGDTTKLKRAALQYLSGADDLGHSPGMRIAAYDRLRASHDRLGIYAEDKPCCGDDVLAVRLPRFDCNRAERLAVSSLRKRWDRRGMRNRARGANEMKRKFDLILAAAHVRHAQAVHLADACDLASAEMREDRCRGPWDFIYYERAVEKLGRPLDKIHRVYVRGHWQCDLAERLGITLPEPENLELIDNPEKDRVFDAAVEPIHFEIVRVESEDGNPIEPWFLEFYQAGALLAPSNLTTELRDARRETRLRLDLPCLAYRPPELLGPTGARETRLHEAALCVGIVLVPAYSLVLGLEYANVGSRTMAMSFARYGEAAQIAQQDDRWTEVGEPSFLTDAFLAIPKSQKRPCAFPIDGRTLDALGALLVRRLTFEGLDEIPVVEPMASLTHKCVPARYVFALRGAMIDVGAMNFLYAHLTSGLAVTGGVGEARHVRLRTHDIRHGAAYRGYKECGSMEVIRRRFHYLSRNDHCVARYVSEPGDPAAEHDDPGEWHISRAEFLALTGAGDAEIDL